MLFEVLQYVATPASREARRFGHLAASISLWSRAGRCGEVWADHERRCHAAVTQAMEGLARRRTVLVLGSGLVRDIDLDALTIAFEVVILADLVHLWPVRIRVMGRPKVRLATIDLAGANGLLLGREAELIDPLAQWHRNAEIDLVISANMLSQLPLLPIEYAARHTPYRLRLKPGELGTAIVRHHLEGLRRFKCRVCLLTDTEQLRRGRDGAVRERRDLLYGVTLPSPPLGWEWTVALFGEAEADMERVHRVAAYPDFLRTEAGGGIVAP